MQEKQWCVTTPFHSCFGSCSAAALTQFRNLSRDNTVRTFANKKTDYYLTLSEMHSWLEHLSQAVDDRRSFKWRAMSQTRQTGHASDRCRQAQMLAETMVAIHLKEQQAYNLFFGNEMIANKKTFHEVKDKSLKRHGSCSVMRVASKSLPPSITSAQEKNYWMISALHITVLSQKCRFSCATRQKPSNKNFSSERMSLADGSMIQLRLHCMQNLLELSFASTWSFNKCTFRCVAARARKVVQCL